MTIEIKRGRASGTWEVWRNGKLHATVDRKCDALAISKSLAVFERQIRESVARIRAERTTGF